MYNELLVRYHEGRSAQIPGSVSPALEPGASMAGMFSPRMRSFTPGSNSALVWDHTEVSPGNVETKAGSRMLTAFHTNAGAALRLEHQPSRKWAGAVKHFRSSKSTAQV